MKKFIIERTLPEAAKMTKEDLEALATKSCDVIIGMNKPYHWVHTYVAEDKLYCVHIAEDKETVLRHSTLGEFPIERILEVSTILDPTFAPNLTVQTAGK